MTFLIRHILSCVYKLTTAAQTITEFITKVALPNKNIQTRLMREFQPDCKYYPNFCAQMLHAQHSLIDTYMFVHCYHRKIRYFVAEVQ